MNVPSNEERVGATYRTLGSKNAVSVKVPSEGGLKLVLAHKFTSGERTVPVANHYRNGDVLKGTKGRVILQRNFFGISQKDFGKKIPARVDVIEKINPGGTIVLLLDIKKKEGDTFFNLVFNTEGGKSDFSLQGIGVCFTRKGPGPK